MRKNFEDDRKYQKKYYFENKEKLQEKKKINYEIAKKNGLLKKKNWKKENKKRYAEKKRYTVEIENETAKKFDEKLKEKNLKYTHFIKEKINNFIKEN